MRFSSLDDWLNWQQNLNPKEIDLGLERVSVVLEKLELSADFFCPVITVAGTNGKGSTVAFVESILHQSTVSVGCYTSPHLFKYNERIRINQQPVSEPVLCEAFETVDQARCSDGADIPLTYFEFGTLAALLIFKKFNVSVAVLEVGLGGRLDAVNVIHADVAVISSISIDHIDWLGDDIELIAREKAGILRRDKPAVLGFFRPQQSILDMAQQLRVPLLKLGEDYLYQGVLGGEESSWQLKSSKRQWHHLPLPALPGGFQMQNAAAAIMAIDALPTGSMPKNTPLKSEMIAAGLLQVKLSGRFQVVSRSPEVIVDVAHNEASAGVLSELLNEREISGQTIAIVAMLADKAVSQVLQTVDSEVDHWISAGLTVSGGARRGLQSKKMAQAVRELRADVKLCVCETVREACEKALALAEQNDRIIIFGSFYTVADAMTFFNLNN
ncbi:Dihydrofolate synthase @ Folylpolyglutamate synthase [hydrothermal vent metagenome]|uniref:Dihydrofolate synthase @ Folylpolyglutamate synthase n=1 Tax=hydrothermal vent metagenome TaxID=652676 RepID=A0A3B0XA01_9ZZZZ